MKLDWQKILGEAARSLVRFPGEALDVFRTPQADSQTTILVLSIVVVALLLLAIVAFFVWSLLGTRRRVEPVVEEPVEEPLPAPESPQAPPPRLSADWIGIGLFVAAVVGLLAIGSYQVSQPSFCAKCHVVKSEYKSWIESSHRQVGCLGCHQEPGVSGYVVQKIGYVREALLFATGNYSDRKQSIVPNRSCNRCHKDLSRQTVIRYGIKVKHQNFLEKGYRCTGCHNTIAHGDIVSVPKYPTMDKCVVCHDGREASAECELCHVSNVAKQVRQPRRELVKIATEIPWHCRGCHSPAVAKKCIDCHGLEMPHSPEFMRGKHARLAFTQKSICVRCHSGKASSCNQCHDYPSPHGPERDWIRQHGPSAKKQVIVQVEWGGQESAGCAGCHYKGTNMCNACHVGQRETTWAEWSSKQKAPQQKAPQQWMPGPEPSEEPGPPVSKE